MSKTAKKTNQKLWDKIKTKITDDDKGGKAAQWSARKAQLAVAEYKKAGGRYEGRKSDDNHLRQWTEEEWGTRSGGRSGDTGERYLPKGAREKVIKKDYDRTTAKKRQDAEKGQQFSRQPADVAKKTKPFRESGTAGATLRRTKAELYRQAKARNIAGRSSMTRAELERAVAS